MHIGLSRGCNILLIRKFRRNENDGLAPRQRRESPPRNRNGSCRRTNRNSAGYEPGFREVPGCPASRDCLLPRIVEVLPAVAHNLRLRAKKGYSEVSEKIGQLKLVSPDGKSRTTDCADTEAGFRIIQTIPSPRAEPFKRWLVKVGYERIQEIEDPELATKRARAIYQAKGYPESPGEPEVQEWLRSDPTL
jgi:hypothetical protein